MRKLCFARIVPLLASLLLPLAALASERGVRAAMPDPATVRGSALLLPLDVIANQRSVGSLAIRVLARERELFRETYAVEGKSGTISLRLEGATPLQLWVAEEMAPGSIRFEITADDLYVRSLALPELFAISAAAARTDAGRNALALPREVQVNRSMDAFTPARAGEVVENPGPQHFTRTVKSGQRKSPGRVSTNSTFVCPSGANGTCDAEYSTCLSGCDPSDPGYYELCLTQCEERYEWCYYGQTSVEELRWFQPLYFIGYRDGFYPWYAIYDIKVWEMWSGDSRYQRRETYHCMYDGSFGPYVVVDQRTADICYRETNRAVDTGAYIDECKF